MAALTLSPSAHPVPLLCDQIAREFGLPAAEVTPEAAFAADLGLSRFDLLEFLDALEARFSISLPDHAADSATIAELEDVLTNCFLSQKFANPFRHGAPSSRRARQALASSRLAGNASS